MIDRGVRACRKLVVASRSSEFGNEIVMLFDRGVAAVSCEVAQNSCGPASRAIRARRKFVRADSCGVLAVVHLCGLDRANIPVWTFESQPEEKRCGVVHSRERGVGVEESRRLGWNTMKCMGHGGPVTLEKEPGFVRQPQHAAAEARNCGAATNGVRIHQRKEAGAS